MGTEAQDTLENMAQKLLDLYVQLGFIKQMPDGEFYITQAGLDSQADDASRFAFTVAMLAIKGNINKNTFSLETPNEVPKKRERRFE